MSSVAQFLDLDVAEAARQWRGILDRRWPAEKKRQVNYVPVEVCMCLGLLLVVDPSQQGGTGHPPILDTLAGLVRRTPRSLADKERNLLGVENRDKGAGYERELFGIVAHDLSLIFHLWRVSLAGARAAGIGPDRLPDILDANGSDGLLGQEELDTELHDLVSEDRGLYIAAGYDEALSERAAVAKARIGQHYFAVTVRANYEQRSGSCGLDTSNLQQQRLLLASHGKPWRDGTTTERLDSRNGVAACPTHDAAFDGGLLTVTDDGRVHRLQLLRDASKKDRVAHTMFTASVADELIVAPESRPGRAYLDWHNERIWRNGIGPLHDG